MLKDKFLESRGAPIEVHGFNVYQIFEIDAGPFKNICIEFEAEGSSAYNGIVIRSSAGKKIFLSDGTLVKSVVTWDDPALPRSICYSLGDGAGMIAIYPKYIVDHGNNFVTKESFSGNSGVVILENLENSYRLGFSSAIGNFDPHNFVARISLC